MVVPKDRHAPEHALSREERAAIRAMSERLAGTLYEVLGVAADCDGVAIRKAYFEAMRFFHPDVYFDRDIGGVMDEIVEMNRALTEAFELLSDPGRRAIYDASLDFLTYPRVPRQSSGNLADLRASVPVAAPKPTPTSPFVPDTARRVTPPVPFVPEAPRRSTPAPPPLAKRTPPPFVPGRTPPPFQGPVVPPPLGRSSPLTPIMPLVPASTATSDPESDEVRRVMAARRFASVTDRPGRFTPPPARHPPSEPPPSVRPSVLASPQAPLEAQPSAHDVGAVQDASRNALERHRQEYQARHQQNRRDDLDAAVTKAAMAEDSQEVLNLLQAAFLRAPDDPALRTRVERAQEVVTSATVDRFITLALTAEKNGRWEPAAGYWQRAAAGRQDDPQLWLNSAEALLQTRADFGRAVEAARRAARLDPTSVAPHLCLTRIFLAAGRTASARGAITEALRLAPESPDVQTLAKRIKT